MRSTVRNHNRNQKHVRSRRRNTVSKRIRTFTTAIILILCVCFSFGTFLASAHESEGPGAVHTYYKSIRIQPGDTLWSIAEDTITSSYDSTAEYVEVLKDMNGLTSDEIHSGSNLIIAYEM